MGQKVSPIGLRVGVIRDWESRWYAEKEYGDLLLEDVKIREFILKECADALVSRVEIERSKNRVNLIIRTARPGIILGQDKDQTDDKTRIKKLNEKLVKLTNENIDELYSKININDNKINAFLFLLPFLVQHQLQLCSQH